MKHRFLPLLAMLAGCFSCSIARSPYAPQQDPIHNISESTAVLIGRDAHGDVGGVCSAVWVSQVELLSAAHCSALAFKDDDEADSEDPIGHEIEFINHSDLGQQLLDGATPSGTGVIVAIDQSKDLMLMSGPRNRHSVATFYTGDIEQGMPLLMLGHTFGLPYSLSTGVLGADRMMRYKGNFRHMLQIVSGASYGNSGGGAWSEDGQLLGLCSFRIEDSVLTFAVHRDVLLSFLKHEGVSVN